MVPLQTQTLAARWIFPIDAPPLEGGTITVHDGKIVAVEPAGTRTPDVHLGNVALLPGFVDAHTHLDLTGARGICPPTPDFTAWLRSVIAFRRSRTPEQVQTDIGAGLAECLRFGTTLIGDIAAGGGSWELIAKSPCRAVIYHELIGLTKAGVDNAWHAAEGWAKDHQDREQFRRGLSPHAPYSVHYLLYYLTSQHWMPIATHLAETEAENELLQDHDGIFVDFLNDMNVWEPSGLVESSSVVMGQFPRGIFVHGNYLDPATPFLPTQTLVVCPRTHAAFGHPHHPFTKMNVRIALGTDSLASNPDLDILAEARFMRLHYPEVAPAAILRMLTLSGAEALGFDHINGSLTAGKSADLVVLPLTDGEERDPHDLVLQSARPVARVMFRGEWIHA